MRTRFTRLQSTAAIAELGHGWPSMAFQRYWQTFCEGLEKALDDIEVVNEAQQRAIEAILAAQAAADAANEAAGVAHAAAIDARTEAVGALDAAAGALDAALVAQSAAGDAAGAATGANEAIAQIEAGDYDLAALKVGGLRFVNNGGVLEVEP